MFTRLVGVGLVALAAFAAAVGTACSSSSGNGNAENEGGTDAGGGGVVVSPEASPWCLIDQTDNPAQITDECSRNSGGDCTIGASGVASCPTENLAGCCKGNASSLEGAGSEVCIYADDYLAADGGAQAWCTCNPPSSGCFGGTWQTTP